MSQKCDHRSQIIPFLLWKNECSDEINKRSDEYWMMVMDIARKFPFARIKKCATIMGRKEEDDLG